MSTRLSTFLCFLVIVAACHSETPATPSDGGIYARVATAHGPVHVWAPSQGPQAATVIYVHGFYTTVDRAWTEHRLPAQFGASGLAATFIACEAPSGPEDAVSWTSLSTLLSTVERSLGRKLSRDRVIVVGHSGAHITVRPWLAEPALHTLVLLDAAYGEVSDFRAWVTAVPSRRLIFVGDDTRAQTDKLHALLSDVVVFDRVPAPYEVAAQSSRIVYVKSNLGHAALVTSGLALPTVLRL
jgi:hypothetical protein